ncbi:ATP-binding protein [Vagococcus fluvialis]|uniref:ATP-binding protein n=1 Tax=Vagococcus fluvialis TaxID=2738 RepID=UPI0020344528|nr:ATP-binding protein [Vagococcus fluvialis]MCM2138926.1 ATP-binding protein [Vagococcus fluvialis]
MNISTGIIAKAQKVVIYGPEGIGKSTLAAQFPSPLFTDTEGSTNNMDVKRFDKPTSWQMLLQQIEFVKNTRPCDTYIIDTADWAELLCIEYICQKYDKKGIEDFGYGNGYTYLGEEFGRLLNKLSELIDVGVNVVLTAHTQIKRFERPDEMGAYDRWELKLGNKKTVATTASLVKEWADMVLFCNFQVTVVSGGSAPNAKKKGVGGKRIMYTTHNPAWDAKNRFGLPDQMDMDYQGIAHIFNKQSNQAPSQQLQSEPTQQNEFINQGQPEPQPDFSREPQQEIDSLIPSHVADLMKLNQVTTEEIMKVIYVGGFMPQDTPIQNIPADLWGYLSTNWDNGVMNLLNTQIRNF